MKNLFLLTISIFYLTGLCAQAPEIEWQKSFGGSANDVANSIQQTSDGGYIVAGSSNSNDGDVAGNYGSNDFWVVKLSGAGNIEWQKSYGGSNWDVAYSIQQRTDGGYIVAGKTYSDDGDITEDHGSGDVWVVKINNIGDIEWQKSYGGSGDDIAFSIQQTTDGGGISLGGVVNQMMEM